MLRTGAVAVLILGVLSACGHTPEERLLSGALIGGAVGAAVGLASDPGHHDNGYYEPDRHYSKKHRGHRHRRHHDEWDDYDDDCCYD